MPYAKKLERVYLTPGFACHTATRRIAIKIKRKGGDYYYYGNKENEKKKYVNGLIRFLKMQKKYIFLVIYLITGLEMTILKIHCINTCCRHYMS